MKKLIITVLVVVAIVAGVSCKKIIKALFPGLDVDAPSVTVTLPAIPFAPPDELQITSYTQHFNLDSIVKERTSGTFNANDVGSVTIKEMVFTLTNGDEFNNLSNFESVRITLTSDSKPEPAEVANITFPDPYTNPTYTYTPATAVDLRPYLNGTQLTYNVYGKIRRITTRPLTLSVRVTLRVE